ncbi:hypothetical protein NNO_1611 [Hydrogenimonas sp.]|nr:hypothetical protein NNO_1611 [Hydrogenimonas sp.]
MGMLMLKPVKYGYINAKCRTLKSDLLDRGFYEKALQAEGLGDIYALLKRSRYAEYIPDAEKESMERGLEASFEELYKKSTSMLGKREREIFDLFFFERERLAKRKLELGRAGGSRSEYRAADLEYIEKIERTLYGMERGPRRDLSKILGSYFDILNLYTVVRLRILYGLEPEEIVPFLAPYGLSFDMAALAEAAGMSTIGEISDLVHEKVGRPFSGYHEFRQALAQYHMKTLRGVWYGYPFKLSIIFSLLRMKEMEIRDIRSLIEGVHYRLPREEIEKMIGGV